MCIYRWGCNFSSCFLLAGFCFKAFLRAGTRKSILWPDSSVAHLRVHAYGILDGAQLAYAMTCLECMSGISPVGCCLWQAVRFQFQVISDAADINFWADISAAPVMTHEPPACQKNNAGSPHSMHSF